MMKSVLLTAAGLAILSMGDLGAHAQVLYSTAGGNYGQNFDTLLTSPEGTDTTWTDNTTLTGWYATKGTPAVTQTAYRPGTGSSNTGALYAFGSTGSTDRALGSLASGGTGTEVYGVRITNTTGQTLTSFDLSYAGEQWRDGGINGSTQSVPNTLAFDYSLNATSLSTGTYTANAGLSFTSLINANGSASALNGNLPANRTSITGTISNLVWLNGTDLWLRWSDINDGGNDHGIALDDLVFKAKPSGAPTATPEPGAIALLTAFGLSGTALLRRRRASGK